MAMLTMMTGMMIAIIIISVIMLCFNGSAVWVIWDFYDNELLTAKLSNGEIMVMDTAVTLVLLF